MADPTELAVLAGQMILENGGETSRVEETMTRMAIACGAEGVDVFATPTGIFCTIRLEGTSYSRVARIRRRGFDLAKVLEVNNISRLISAGKLSAEEAFRRLTALNTQGRCYPTWLHLTAGGAASSAFAYLYGAHGGTILAAGLTGVLVMAVLDFLQDRKIYFFVAVALAGAASALVNLLLKTVWPRLEFDLAVIGSIMLMVPGLALTTTIRDALTEDLISSSVRGFEALGIALSIAVGVGLILALYLSLGGTLL